MEVLLAFCIAFFFSFIGTIPPGTINLLIIQLGLEHRLQIALRLATAACIVEYLYAWLAVEFEALITSSPVVTENFELITAVVMLSLGLIGLLSKSKPTGLAKRFNESGFRRGIILGILNPLALPFWVAMTAYIKGQGWLTLSTAAQLHAYLLGVAIGGFALLMLFAYLAKKVVSYLHDSPVVKKIPAITLLLLGLYATVQYFL